MVDTSLLKHGYVVKIVDQWEYCPYEDHNMDMDRFRGKLMTVAQTGLIDNCVTMLEDTTRWLWSSYDIDFIVVGDQESFEEVSESELDDFLGGM